MYTKAQLAQFRVEAAVLATTLGVKSVTMAQVVEHMAQKRHDVQLREGNIPLQHAADDEAWLAQHDPGVTD